METADANNANPPPALRLKPVKSGGRFAWAELHGTILTLFIRHLDHVETADIPLELLTVTRKKNIRWRDLQAAFAVLWIAVCVCLLIHRAKDPALLGVAGVAGGLLFAVLLVRSLIPQDALVFHIEREDLKYAFWTKRKDTPQIEAFVSDLSARKAYALNISASGLLFPFFFSGEKDILPPHRSAVMIYALIPMIVLQVLFPKIAVASPILLLLCPAAAVAWWFYQKFRQPPALRKATRHIQRNEWQAARDALTAFIREHPHGIQTYPGLFDTCLQCDDLDGAETVLADMKRLLPGKLQEHDDTLRHRRQITERKKGAHAPP
ncbi:MAG: hypothetical protein FWG50_10195 [Kiritimatiellaeota bacterium]|nr:hypothetical protein [Kiritimatiellota bacterium]